MYCVLYVSLNNKKVRETSTCFARDKKMKDGGRGRKVSLSMMVWKKKEGAWCFTCRELRVKN
jgi:hypothetical protein